MNKLLQIRQLILNDATRYLFEISVAWLSAISIPIFLMFMGDSKLGKLLMCAATTGLYFLLGILLIRVIQLKPQLASGGHPHWSQVLIAKIMVVWIFLLQPIWLAQIGSIFALGIRYDFLDLTLCFIERMLNNGAWMAGLALFPLFLPKFYQSILAVIATTTVYFLILLMSLDNSGGARVPDSWYTHLVEHSAGFISETVLIATALTTAASRYVVKSIVLSALITAGGVYCAYRVPLLWTYDISQLFAEYRPGLYQVKSPLREQLRIVETADFGRDFTLSVFVKGLDPSFYANVIGFHGEVRLSSGKTCPCWRDDRLVRGMLEDKRRRLLGFPGKNPSDNSFEVSVSNLEKDQLHGARVTGTISLDIRQAFIVWRGRLKAGVTVLIPRRSYRINSLSLSGPNGLTVEMASEEVPLDLRGDTPGDEGSDLYTWDQVPFDPIDNLSFLVFNPARKQYLYLFDTDFPSADNSSGFICSQTFLPLFRLYRFTNPDWNSASLIQPDWLNEAEIAFFSSKSFGQISVPFNVTLK